MQKVSAWTTRNHLKKKPERWLPGTSHDNGIIIITTITGAQSSPAFFYSGSTGRETRMASRPEYQSLDDVDDHTGATHEDSALLGGQDEDGQQVPFSWIEYGIFCFLGMAMLWAW